ncbi:MAG TPA: GNAT family N-acetyltransferase [Mycobacteriales bacterium]|nr:GNAT family N-acetyltransferase [Mycobacteriales bacterium]
MLRSAPTRVLGDRDFEAVIAVLDRDPIENVMVAARIQQAGVEPARLGAELWGHVVDGELRALCFSGANLVPVSADEPALAAFAERARRQGRRCSSIVGEAGQVLALWHRLQPHWGSARDVREDQPLLAISGPPAIQGDPAVRLVREHELDLLLPAAIAMYTEEIGFSPAGSDGGALYRARIAELIAQRRAYARIEDGRVLFKAEIGAATRAVLQVQGVWVDPALRGTGLGTAGTAAVVEAARRDIAPLVTLYVNAHNVAARRAYDRIGFARVGTFASVLF